jgi:hypothetical protein
MREGSEMTSYLDSLKAQAAPVAKKTGYVQSLRVAAARNETTENGALTFSTSTNSVLDFFALAGAMRDNLNDARTLFRKAFAEDKQLAVRALFYLRDVRGGQGERQLFRELFRDLVRLDLATAEKVLHFVPEYGRWDDVVSLYGFGGLNVRDLIAEKLRWDENGVAEGKSVSLLAKWLPSENASSANSRAKARQIASDLGMSHKEYRQRIVALRKHIGLLEQQMSSNEWSEIDYGHIPSQASRKHNKAFRRHDSERFEGFLEKVMSDDSPEVTMNAGTLFTYEIVDVIRKGDDATANALWKSLPDYTNGKNAIVVADTSGSMGAINRSYSSQTQPIDVSVSLALYFAERNTGPFQGYFITFSERPELVAIKGNTLTEKLHNINRAHWDMNTNIQAVFDLILNAAVSANASQEEIPQTVYIVSDMEFDQAEGGYYYRERPKTNFELAREKFTAAGYELPTLVFWNVAARNTNTPATQFDKNVTMISGLSQSTFRYAVQGKSPMESMLDILNGERYAQITV